VTKSEKTKTKTKILIVEDEEIMLRLLGEKFWANGYDVLVARNGKEGLDMAIKDHPDIILLDVKMPVMDGITMMKKVREDTWGKDVPIIILTVLDPDDKILKEIGTYESSYYLVKGNVNLDDLVHKVEDRLKGK